MTYLTFHLLFILPPLAVLAFLNHRRPRVAFGGLRPATAVVAVAFIALIYTTPWDNYLVWRGVWAYGPDRVLGTIGYVPFEEYLFFLLQPLLTGAWLTYFLSRQGASAPPRKATAARWVGAAFYAAAALAGLLVLRREPTVYLGLILVWSGPVLALQWAYAAPRYLQLLRPLLWAVATPTLYLWIADRIAIASGIWRISERFTTGLQLAGLPMEEAVFFLMTNLLVVQGVVLFVVAGRQRGTL